MESRILNSAAARVASTSAHFIGGKRNHTFAGGFHQFNSEKTIRSLQYSIPAVGNHYGNAFAPDDEIDDDGGEDEDCRGLRTVTLGPYSQSMNVGSITDGEYYDEDDEEIDEDVEMSPAIEVISIDPNCDYDSDEEEEEEEEEQIREAIVELHPPVTHQAGTSNDVPVPEEAPSIGEQIVEQTVVVQETVLNSVRAEVPVEENVIECLESDDIEPELENIHRDSDEEGSGNNSSSDSNSSSSSSDSSSDSDSSKSSRSRSRSRNNSSSSRSGSSRSTSTASSHPCTKSLG